MGAVAADREGRRHYIGVFEPDGHYTSFISQGAKRYAYIDDDDHMNITVSGVSKAVNENTGESYAVEELRNYAYEESKDKELPDCAVLKYFRPGMIWHKAGGNTIVYNDWDNFEWRDEATGKTVWIMKNAAIIDTTYEMKYSKDYAALLNEISLMQDFRRERE